jgi:hypothetical protein
MANLFAQRLSRRMRKDKSNTNNSTGGSNDNSNSSDSSNSKDKKPKRNFFTRRKNKKKAMLSSLLERVMSDGGDDDSDVFSNNSPNVNNQEGNDADMQPVSLTTLFIQSHDTLRGYEIDATVPPTWNDRAPLLRGPKGQPETPHLLKGVSSSITITMTRVTYCWVYLPSFTSFDFLRLIASIVQ